MPSQFDTFYKKRTKKCDFAYKNRMKNEKIINSKNLLHNLNHFAGRRVCAMVKSNAYGHGMREIAEILNGKVAYFGVVSADEGAMLRRYTDAPILICAKTEDFAKCRRFDLEVMVENERDILRAKNLGMHLKIDCGMHRFGVSSEIEMKMIDRLLEEKGIVLKSIYTHFPCTDNFKATEKHYRKFLNLSSLLSQKTSICFGGSGILQYPFEYDMQRVGIGLYGYGEPSLRPVMQIASHVTKIFHAKRGDFIGYGQKYKVKKDGVFAVVNLGYGDGLFRGLSSNFKVEINSKNYDCVGNICMDAFFVKVDENVRVGDRVIVMKDAQVLAKRVDTISYEILTNFSKMRGKTIII